MAASSDGFVWVATDKGLVRINGADSVFYTVADHSAAGFLSDNVLSVDCDSNNNVWIGTDAGLMTYDGITFVDYFADGLGSNYITSITCQGRTTKWISTGTRLYGGSRSAGVARYTGDGFELFDPDTTGGGLISRNVKTVSSHFELGRWYEWFGTAAAGLGEAGVCIFDGMTWDTPSPQVMAQPYRIRVEFDENEATPLKWKKWLCTHGSGVFVSRDTIPGAFTQYTYSNSGLVSDYVRSMEFDENRAKWFATDQGVSIFDDTVVPVTWSTITSADGLPSDDVYAVDFDEDGNVWFGTDFGVAVKRGGDWTYHQRIETDTSFISGNIVTAVSEQLGPICMSWFGGTGGLFSYDGNVWSLLKHGNSRLPSNDVRDVALEEDGTKWICTSNGIVSAPGGPIIEPYADFTLYQAPEQPATIGVLLSNDVRQVVIDADNDKWFATDKGISVFDGTDWTNYMVSNAGLPSNDVRSLAFDSVGRVFVGTDSGVCALEGGTVTALYNVSNSDIPSNDIRAILVDRNGIKWIATDAGVCRLFGSVFTIYDTTTTYGRLPSNNVLSLHIDRDFNLWACTDAGVSVYDYAEWAVYGATDGPLGCQVNCVADDCLNGKWFGTTTGVTLYRVGRWTCFSGVGLGSNMIHDLKIDGAGKVWVATDNGVSCFESNRWSTYNRQSGGPSHDYVTRITIDMDDNKWFATSGGGVSLYLENHPRDLSAPMLFPTAGVPTEYGAPGTEFEYSIQFSDPDLDVSSLDYEVEAYVYIDGVPHEMELGSGVTYNGVYSFTMDELPEGNHCYYFYFQKPSGAIIKLPETGVYAGPIVDGTPPTSGAFLDGMTEPYTSSSTFDVHFTATDPQSNVKNVYLYFRVPGGEWIYTGLDRTNGEEHLPTGYGYFEYSTQTSGTYEFCTIAENNAGLFEELPDEADCEVIYDRRGPTSQILNRDGTPQSSAVFRIEYSATDVGSGIAYVELWHRKPGAEDYPLSPVRTSELASGRFIYTAEQEGWHDFYLSLIHI